MSTREETLEIIARVSAGLQVMCDSHFAPEVCGETLEWMAGEPLTARGVLNMSTIMSTVIGQVFVQAVTEGQATDDDMLALLPIQFRDEEGNTVRFDESVDLATVPRGVRAAVAAARAIAFGANGEPQSVSAIYRAAMEGPDPEESVSAINVQTILLLHSLFHMVEERTGRPMNFME